MTKICVKKTTHKKINPTLISKLDQINEKLKTPHKLSLLLVILEPLCRINQHTVHVRQSCNCTFLIYSPRVSLWNLIVWS